jgi:thiosulfate dehydrogenase
VKRFLGSVFLGVCLCLVAEFLFLTRGGMPVGTRGGPLPFERFLAATALRTAIGPSAGEPSPIPADPANLVAGAHVYREECEVCHGAWGRPKSPIAAGMYPPPPQLLPPRKGVTDDPVGETHWKVKNGIRLTGMPGFEGALSDTEIWQVSLLLRHAAALPADARQVLQR